MGDIKLKAISWFINFEFVNAKNLQNSKQRCSKRSKSFLKMGRWKDSAFARNKKNYD
jgi:hypothetical protein